MPDLYETDFYAWTREQAELLPAGKLPAADVAHIAEEIESMGRSERNQLAPDHPRAAPPHRPRARPEPGPRCRS